MRDVLAKGCALDLHHTVFRSGSSAQTTVGPPGVVLPANHDPGEFTVLVRQSFALTPQRQSAQNAQFGAQRKRSMDGGAADHNGGSLLAWQLSQVMGL